MGDITGNTIFIKFIIFYSILISLIIIMPFEDVVVVDIDGENITALEPTVSYTGVDGVIDAMEAIPVFGSIITFFEDLLTEGSKVFNYIDLFFVRLTGLPVIVNDIIFFPMKAIAVFFLIKFLAYLFPYAGD